MLPAKTSALVVVLTTFLAGAAVACSSAGTTEGSATSTASLLETCSGDYTCAIDGSTEPPKDARVHREGTACYVGGLRLDPDGKASSDGVDATWSGDADRFRVCVTDGCLACTSRTPHGSPGSDATGATGKQCKGVSDSCYGRAAGTCSGQAGCRFTQHVRYDGTLAYTCEGSSTDCSELTSEASCKGQDGCRWE